MPKPIIFSPGRIVLISIFFTICLGTFLLTLPISQAKPISFIDCLFTATSSTCITGVFTVPLESFTTFGKILILILIQIGGIGLATLTIFFASLFVNLGLATKLIMGQILELSKWKNAKEMIIFIILFTLAIEGIGALGLFYLLKDSMGSKQALFNSIFFSISAFCSAGLSPFANSMMDFRNNLPILSIIGTLIFFGTIGFIPIFEIFGWIRNRINGKRYKISLTTRVILTVTTALVVIATLLLLALEGQSQFGQSGWLIRISNMLFNAFAYRSTGFTTLDISTLKSATLFMILMYSFIGSSPGSTGSGIKVTTFAVIIATIKAVITGRSTVNLKGRRIPQDQVFKALSILALAFCWIVIATFLLLLTESNAKFINVFFEILSSFTTLGLKNFLAPILSVTGKLIIIATMFFGRLGTLTLLLSIQPRPPREEFTYPEERLMMS